MLECLNQGDSGPEEGSLIDEGGGCRISWFIITRLFSTLVLKMESMHFLLSELFILSRFWLESQSIQVKLDLR